MDKLKPAGRRQSQLDGEGRAADIEPYGSVGARLRAARLAAGYELSEVAQELRLSPSQLLAIEQGRFDDLPGAVYAVGYLRSYAELLALDAEEMVRLFKDEARGFVAPAQLVFPTPSPQGRRPAAPLVMVSLVAAGAVWGAWHYLSAQDRVGIEAVPEVPERLATALVEPAPREEVSANEGEEGAVEETAAPERVAPAREPVETGEVSSAVPASGPGGGRAAPPAPHARAENLAVTPPSVATARLGPAGLASAPSRPAVALPPPDLPVSPRAGGGGYVPQVYGAGNREARVVVRARMDSWIQIKGADDELVLTRTLRAGDVYRVPNRADLVMVTGNAGGIEITVDDRLVAPIGPVGAVRRDISLDAESLLRLATGE